MKTLSSRPVSPTSPLPRRRLAKGVAQSGIVAVVVMALAGTFAADRDAAADVEGSAALCTGPTQAGEAEAAAPQGERPPRSSAVLPDFAPCTSGAECASGMCAEFREEGGRFCAVPCLTRGDCPAASKKCNRQGVCRMPKGRGRDRRPG